MGNHILRSENIKTNGSLSVIFVNDPFIQNLNKRFFNKNNPTDVIAFVLDDKDKKEWGEIYISTERTLAQAKEYGVDFHEELARLIIHGILHLVGYIDGDDQSKQTMRMKEDYYLNYFVS